MRWFMFAYCRLTEIVANGYAHESFSLAWWLEVRRLIDL